MQHGPWRTSRLGCQSTVTEDLDGLVIKVPDETRNMMMCEQRDDPFRPAKK